MKLWMIILGAVVALGLAACVQVGPSGDKPLHIVMDVNIKVQVDEAVMNLWDNVEAKAGVEPGAKVDVPPEENQ